MYWIQELSCSLIISIASTPKNLYPLGNRKSWKPQEVAAQSVTAFNHLLLFIKCSFLLTVWFHWQILLFLLSDHRNSNSIMAHKHSVLTSSHRPAVLTMFKTNNVCLCFDKINTKSHWQFKWDLTSQDQHTAHSDLFILSTSHCV